MIVLEASSGKARGGEGIPLARISTAQVALPADLALIDVKADGNLKETVKELR